MLSKHCLRIDVHNPLNQFISHVNGALKKVRLERLWPEILGLRESYEIHEAILNELIRLMAL